MTNPIGKDLGEIYTRLFDARPFLRAELAYFVKEFEEKRNDREVEGLFTALLNTAEVRDSSLPKGVVNSQTQLPALKEHLNVAQQAILDLEKQLGAPDQWESTRSLNRAGRQQLWTQFEADIVHKTSRVDNTFEEKEEELREFYSDLERKLRIHI